MLINNLKVQVLLIITAVATTAVFFMPAIPQDPAYHIFVDGRTLLGINNFWNVSSNLVFVIVGIIGLLAVAFSSLPARLPELNIAYYLFFIGVCLTGVGSSYYHLGPSNATLVWDRLPMTISFMAFFSVIAGEQLSPTVGRRLLWPLLVLGLLSVVYWHYTEGLGEGDLRAYGLVQFLPILLVPVLLLGFRPRFSGNIYLWAVIGGYLLSKLLEQGDAVIYDVIGIGGHALKHVAAAAATAFFYLALKKRKPLN